MTAGDLYKSDTCRYKFRSIILAHNVMYSIVVATKIHNASFLPKN